MFSQAIANKPYLFLVIPLSTFMTFNKIKVLLNGGNENVLRKALSRSAVLELSEDQLKVRRKENAPVKSQDEIDECTIYVEQVPINSTHESLEKIFSKFGKVNVRFLFDLISLFSLSFNFSTWVYRVTKSPDR